MKELHQRLGVTSIFVTHDQEEALSLSDRIAVMREGRVEQFGTPEEVYARPLSKYVARFIGSPPLEFLSGRVEGEGGMPVFRVGAAAFPLSLKTAERLVQGGQNCALGVRPEHVLLGPSGIRAHGTAGPAGRPGDVSSRCPGRAAS